MIDGEPGGRPSRRKTTSSLQEGPACGVVARGPQVDALQRRRTEAKQCWLLHRE